MNFFNHRNIAMIFLNKPKEAALKTASFDILFVYFS
jgi:hypothetical protein